MRDPTSPNSKEPTEPNSLPNGASNAAYRTYRHGLVAWLHTCMEYNYREAGVRNGLLKSLDDKTRTVVISHFAAALGTTTVGQILHLLDVNFQMLAQVDDKESIRDFVNCHRKRDESLQAFLQRWSNLLAKARAAEYVPDTNLASTLLARAEISLSNRALLHGKLREYEEKIGKPLTGFPKHKEMMIILQ